MRMYVHVLSVLFLMFATASFVSAQSAHTASQAALDAAVQEHSNAAQSERAEVQRLLERADVRAVAQGAGIDLRSAAAAVSVMDPASLTGVVSQARVVDQALAGGQSKVTINTTLLIIGLLVLILLIVALK